MAFVDVVIEVLAEFVGEFVLSALSATVGVAIAAASYRIWLGARRRAWGLVGPRAVTTPDGERYDLFIDGWQFRVVVADRTLGLRSHRAAGSTGPPTSSLADSLHPRRQLEGAQGCLIVVAPLVLVAVLAVALLAIIEVMVLGWCLGLLAAGRVLFGRSWTVVVRNARAEWAHTVDRLGAAKQLVDVFENEIRAGNTLRATHPHRPTGRDGGSPDQGRRHGRRQRGSSTP